MFEDQDFQISKKITWPVNSVLERQQAKKRIQRLYPSPWWLPGTAMETAFFASSEFLTGQQISSFFSRLASKRTLENGEMTESDIKESQGVEDEEAFRKLRSYNICELIADSKLSKFAIQMLQDICEHFDIPITDIKVKRKAPYIERLITFGRKCTCQGKV